MPGLRQRLARFDQPNTLLQRLHSTTCNFTLRECVCSRQACGCSLVRWRPRFCSNAPLQEDGKRAAAGYAWLLREATSLSEGKRIHARILASGLDEDDALVGSHLVRMYLRLGSLHNARELFYKMQVRDVVLWTATIAANAQNGHRKEAFLLFQQMQLQGVTPNSVTLVAALGACSDVAQGRLLHGLAMEKGFDADVVVGTAIANMYGKCGDLVVACQMFARMQQRNAVSWNAMIALHIHHGHCEEAFRLFRQMQLEGTQPNKNTYVTALNGCDRPATLAEGKRIHARISACDGLESDVVVATALVKMYGKCGEVEDARRVFEQMPHKNAVSWNTMIGAYAAQRGGCCNEALQVARLMMLESVVMPDRVTFLTLVNACIEPASLAAGRLIHACIRVCVGLEQDVVLGNAVVSMYSRCGSLQEATATFHEMMQHGSDVVSWCSIIAAFAREGDCNTALVYFRRMKLEGTMPDRVAFLTVLHVCSSLANLAEGKRAHECLVESGVEVDVEIATGLVTMYAKCGSLERARAAFDSLGEERDMILWTVMISAYAHHGHGKLALELSFLMQHEGVKPDDITFVKLLSACSHAGLVEEGCFYFHSMTEYPDITPTLEQCGCMVDLLGRAGRLDEAEKFLGKLPIKPPSAFLWMTLLAACRVHGDVERGKRAAEQVLKLEGGSRASAYVVLGNMYAPSPSSETLKSCFYGIEEAD